jgi:hypothetical protein
VFTRPDDLTDAQVRDALVRGWALDVVRVEHAPVGFGSHHWWVTTGDGCRWFATADDLRTRRLTADEPLSESTVRLDPAREAWRLVVDGRARLGPLVDRYARLVGDVDLARFVLTHGEPDRGNTLVARHRHRGRARRLGHLPARAARARPLVARGG